ncbi:MAG: hypothetical protein ACI30J_07780 [Paludibacteraceae bacterium]
MKKVFLLAALLVASMSMMAEEPQSAMNQVVWHNGKVMYGSPIPTVDSITFAAEIESSDTLHLILPRTIIKEVHDTTIKEVIKEVIVEVHDTIIKKVYQCPEEPLAGVFSVSADKQVRFSKGNLQYTQSTDTWSIADNQYDMLGTANVENSALADKIDLFGWSGSTGAAKWGISTSDDNNDYSGDFVDWGQNVGNGTTWRTLTSAEWNYLRSSRANAASLMGVARINLDWMGTTYANGLILLPDSWTCPDGVTFKSGFASEYHIEAYADYQTFTLEQWEQLEAAGAVFLPASGYCGGSSVINVQGYGYYWSATPDGSSRACYLRFLSDGAGWGGNFRYNGQAVRLVQDL